MRAFTSLSLFALALALYATPAVQAKHAAHPVRQLSDQNLFEVHLQQGAASSHKRLPSEVMNHHERSEEAEEDDAQSSSTATAAQVSSEVDSKKTFSARQPNHFIKHFKHSAHKFAKRRLTELDFDTTTHFERDSDDLDSTVWSVPALVARVFDAETSLWSRSTSESESSEHSLESTPPTPQAQSS